MIQSHDFASTYVGTPFYMSPEICAAEKYTLKSDIWSLGCIIYELCSREPPFNAKSHFQLVQRIKEGKIAPLPAIYSAELMAVIKDCLKVNPERRPDTAQLLNLPVVRLMRKEKEVVEFSKMLKAKEEALDKRIRELDQKLSSVETDKAYMRQEIDSSLRREWEVKARLEIDRLVNQEIENLQKKFEEEVQNEVNTRVDAELAKFTVTKKVSIIENEVTEFSSSLAKSDYPYSSIGGGSVDEFPSTTDITEYDSPEPPRENLKKNARTPFARAQTMFATAQGHAAGTPMDIEMASPSPITIASLSLSPRRNAATKAPHNPSNIFTANQVVSGDPRWEVTRDSSGLVSDSDSDDEEPPVPSPTRMIKSIKNPFTSKNRPALHATKTAPTGGRAMQSRTTAPLHHAKTANVLPSAAAAASSPDLLSVRPQGSSNILRERCSSPNRRLSKIPSKSNLNPNSNSSGSNSGSDSGTTAALSRQPSFSSKPASIPEGSGLVSKVGAKAKAAAAAAAAATTTTNNNNNNNNGVRGRTLVELQQARAGGRPMSAVLGVGENSIAAGTGPQSPTKRAFREHFAGRTGAAALEPAPVWDPERDEMPSPFLVRRKVVGRF